MAPSSTAHRGHWAKEIDRVNEEYNPHQVALGRTTDMTARAAKAGTIVLGAIGIGLSTVVAGATPPIGFFFIRGIIGLGDKLVTTGENVENAIRNKLKQNAQTPVSYKIPSQIWSPITLDVKLTEAFMKDCPMQEMVTPCNSCSIFLHSSRPLHRKHHSQSRSLDPQRCDFCKFLDETIQLANKRGLESSRTSRHEWEICGPNEEILLRGHSINLSRVNTSVSRPTIDSRDPEVRVDFRWLRALVEHCNTQHPCMKENSKLAKYPTRLIDVQLSSSTANQYSDLKLTITSDMGYQPKYAALSYRWGEEGPFRTLLENVQSRMRNGFRSTALPKTLQHAIRVTRELGLRYIWADSLCIIQDNEEDKDFEIPNMDNIYLGAYITLAATCAPEHSTGFLHRRSTEKRSIFVRDDKHKLLHMVSLCGGEQVFTQDVESADLNTRGWVYQERILSRRIVHFGKQQVYFECGEGLHFEDMRQLKCEKASWKYFSLDTRFPDRLNEYSYAHKLEFVTRVLEDYTRCYLGRQEDRYAAMKGLLNRMDLHLKGQRYGIFKHYQARNLLWQRSSEFHKPRIPELKETVPSWSWMAYPGRIQFIKFGDRDRKKVKFGNLVTNLDVEFSPERTEYKALRAKIWSFHQCGFGSPREPEGRYIITAAYLGGQNIGWVQFDYEQYTNISAISAVPVVKSTTEDEISYYIIAVTKSSGKWVRVGTGMIRDGFIIQNDCQVCIW